MSVIRDAGPRLEVIVHPSSIYRADARTRVLRSWIIILAARDLPVRMRVK